MTVARICITSLVALFLLSNAGFAVENNTLRWNVSVISLKRGSDKNDAPVVSGISVHPSAPRCAVVGDDHLIRIYNSDSKSIESMLSGHSDWVRCTKYSIDGEKLFSAGNDRKILTWTRGADNQYSHKMFAEETRATTGMAVSADGKYLATVGFSKELNIYEIASGNRIFQFECPCADMREVAFSPTENIVAAGGRCGMIRLWHVDSGNPIRDYQPHKLRIRGLAFSKDGLDIVSCGEDRIIAVTRLNKVISPTRTTELQSNKLMSLAVIDQDRIAIGGTNNLVSIWNIADLTRAGRLAGHTGTVAALDASDGQLISGGYDTAIRVWNWNPTVAEGTPTAPVQFSGFSNR